MLQGVPSILFREEETRSPSRLTATLSEQHVTRIVLVPTLLRALIEAASHMDEHLPDLKYWTCSGEILSNDDYKKFRTIWPNSILLNLYGSTEASADVTYYECGAQEGELNIPIGRAISNNKVFLLDGNLQPVPIGIPGELCVCGDGLSRGYLNHTTLTAEKFVVNPFSVRNRVLVFIGLAISPNVAQTETSNILVV